MATEPDTHSRERFGRVSWVILALLLVFAVLAGIPQLAGWAKTWAFPLLVPPAIGLPALWPPLRIAPLGETTTAVWLIDLVGVAVMLLAAIVQLRAVRRRLPRPGHGRAFVRGIWTTIVAFAAGNIVRSIASSFLLHADLGTYIGQLLATIVVAAILGFVVGVVIGLIAALVSGPAQVDTYSSAEVEALFRA